MARTGITTWAAACLVVAACGDDGNKPKDASVDAPSDVASDGPCAGGDAFFTGEYVDFDSTDTQFCGIFNATFQVHGDASRVAHTAPNGRFQLCIAAAALTQVDITPPSAQSECSNPKSTYDVPGIVIADSSVFASGAMISTRSFTNAREAHYNYLNTKAQVFVHVDGTPRAVAITGTSDLPLAFDGTTWAQGATGVNVWFPNVDPTPGTTTISMSGTALGTGSVPIAAGTFTYATLVAN